MNSLPQPVLSDEDDAIIKDAILEYIFNHPPTIGVIGVSGTGKSSTINAMFRTNLAISHVVACTKEFRDINLRVNVTGGQAQGQGALLRIVDAPGLGENIHLDPLYLEMYKKNLVRCDIILWVLSARNRAIALDQIYLSELREFADKMVFGINQVDLVEPMDWNKRINHPSEEQERNIHIIAEDRKQKLQMVLNRDLQVVPYSARSKYNLQELFTTLVKSCQKPRAWIFSAIKGFRPGDFLPENARDRVMQMLAEERQRGGSHGKIKYLPNAGY